MLQRLYHDSVKSLAWLYGSRPRQRRRLGRRCSSFAMFGELGLGIGRLVVIVEDELRDV